MIPTKKQPLFIVTGASCAGKSTICELLFKKEKEYIVLEGDILWNDSFNTPEDGYREYRRLWMRVCANISQIGKPVVLCGCTVPEQFENTAERELFSAIYYIAVTCSQDELLRRMKDGRGVTDENWIKSSMDFNNWLILNADSTKPVITILDTTDNNPKKAADELDKWIMERITPKPCCPLL